MEFFNPNWIGLLFSDCWNQIQLINRFYSFHLKTFLIKIFRPYIKDLWMSVETFLALIETKIVVFTSNFWKYVWKKNKTMENIFVHLYKLYAINSDENDLKSEMDCTIFNQYRWKGAIEKSKVLKVLKKLHKILISSRIDSRFFLFNFSIIWQHLIYHISQQVGIYNHNEVFEFDSWSSFCLRYDLW